MMEFRKTDTPLTPEPGRIGLFANEAGDVMTIDPDGVQAPLVANIGLMVYVDAGGNGDYLTIQEAIDDVDNTNGDIAIVVTSPHNEPSAISISSVVNLIILGGTSVGALVLVPSITLVDSSSAALTISGNGILVTTLTNNAGCTLMIRNIPLYGALMLGGGTTDIRFCTELPRIDITGVNPIMKIFNSVLEQGIQYQGSYSSSPSYVMGCRIGPVIAPVALTNQKFYNNVFTNALPANFEVTAGNYSNVVGSLTWPTIP